MRAPPGMALMADHREDLAVSYAELFGVSNKCKVDTLGDRADILSSYICFRMGSEVLESVSSLRDATGISW